MADVTQHGTIRVAGLGDVSRALAKAAVDGTNLSPVIYDIGMIVVRAADVPVLSGALKASLRAGRGRQKAVVRAGSARVPYAAVQEYGYRAHNIPATFAINRARDQRRAQIVARLEAGINDVLRRAGLL